MSQATLPQFWMMSEGKDPTRIGFGLPAELETACPGFAWVERPRPVDGGRFLGLFCAPDFARARVVASLVAALGDAITVIWAAELNVSA